jgi:hypothetical protein
MNVHDLGKLGNGNLYFYLHGKAQISNIRAKDPIASGTNTNVVSRKKACPSPDLANKN